jgi:hypothetical protein
MKRLLTSVSEVKVILQPREEIEWMSKSVAFQKIVRDRLFFSAKSAADKWTLASCRIDDQGLEDLKQVEIGPNANFVESLTPSILELRDGGFIMAFAGRRNRSDNRRLFMAQSKSLEGPWMLTDQIYTPRKEWEGRNIDLGPGSYIWNNIGYLFFSSAYPSIRTIAKSLLKSPVIPTRTKLMRFEKRCIGMLQLELQTQKIIGSSDSPLPLRSIHGEPFESVFCPGYLTMGSRHFLFVTGSNYSKGFPFDQVIGVAESTKPPHEWDSPVRISQLLGSKDLPENLSVHTAFDTPDAILLDEAHVNLYFSAMSRENNKWHILSCDLRM